MVKNIGWSESRKELDRQAKQDRNFKFIKSVILFLFSGAIIGGFIMVASKTFVEWICG